MASTVRPLMEKPASSTRDQHQQLQQQQQQQQQLKCPRCDSSNTKFCYYNNYSLSQPRHFCKSCKRYWTRGGTLRNVPVGGGCRKNKRVKRPSIDGASHAPTSSVAVAAASSATVSDPPHTRLPQIENLSSATANSNPLNLNTLFYGNLPIGHHPEMNNNLTFPRLSSLYDLPPQLNALGLGFSSANGIICGNSGDGSFQEGYSTAGNSIQDLAMQTNPLLPSSYNSVFGSSCSSSSTTTTVPATMASLIASTIQYQQKFMIDASGLKESRGLSANYFKQSVSPFEELEGLGNSNDVKIEESPNRTEWSMNPTEQTGLSDPGSIRWSTSNVGNSWHDPASNINLGSSVPSLI